MARAFVIRPFDKKRDETGREIDFTKIHDFLIQPALEKNDLEGSTTGEIVEPGNIREDMFALILEADLVICDITLHNANVFYELGIRHALRKKRTVMIRGRPCQGSPPFDILTDRYLAYEIEDPAASVAALSEAIQAAMTSERDTDSPIFKLLPNLTEADPSAVQMAPLDFIEEVERARAAGSKGWLRLLSDEVRQRRFQWSGLELVAQAQWDLEDWEAARQSWEAIRNVHPLRPSSNLALANIYERRYRQTRAPQDLTKSDQAIDRVLENDNQDRALRAEALALRGRNQKTRWRMEFEALPTLEERRKSAMNRLLIDCFESYKKAFHQDLNAFWPGLAALQAGTILLSLSEESYWPSCFDDDDAARAYRRKLDREIPGLQACVDLAVSAANRGQHGDKWSRISSADALFLSEDNPDRIIRKYLDAVPKNDPFARGAATGQLQLFENLGVKPKVAAQVVEALEKRDDPPIVQAEEKPRHLVVVVGHQIDAPNRKEPRFPANREGRGRELLRDAIRAECDESSRMMGLASGASGTDILAHEIFRDLGMEGHLCLPIERKLYAELAYPSLNSWRERFLRLLNRENLKTLELSDSAKLPRWLRNSGTSVWQRGSRWTIRMAQSWDADRVTLIALWDGLEDNSPGGTAELVEMARKAALPVRVIPTQDLLNAGKGP